MFGRHNGGAKGRCSVAEATSTDGVATTAEATGLRDIAAVGSGKKDKSSMLTLQVLICFTTAPCCTTSSCWLFILTNAADQL